MPKSLYFPGAYAGRDEYRNYEYLAEVTEYLSLLFLGLHCPIHPPHMENRRNTDGIFPCQLRWDSHLSKFLGSVESLNSSLK